MKTICIITGASSGIGLEFAKQLDRKFDELWLIARRKERLVEIGGLLDVSVLDHVVVGLDGYWSWKES